jgi:localization factor PodJL
MPHSGNLEPRPESEHRQGSEADSQQRRAAPDLKDILNFIADQIVDADRRHSDVLKDMQERLIGLSGEAGRARTDLPEEYAGTFERIESKIAGLAERIGDLDAEMRAARQARESVRLPSATQDQASSEENAARQPEQAGEPWDEQTAEALANLYESGEADLRPRPPLDEQSSGPTAPAAASASQPTMGWQEKRFNDLVARLEQLLAAVEPDRWFDQLARRIDELDAHFAAALDDVAQRKDVEGLRLVEAHVLELSSELEHTKAQLGRLEAIDSQLRELARTLDQQRQTYEEQKQAFAPPPAGLTDAQLTALVETAAESAAKRAAAAISAPVQEQRDQALAPLQTMLQSYIAENRDREQRMSDLLQALQAMLAHLAERVESIEAKSEEPDAGEKDPPYFESSPLLKAYLEGARALEETPRPPPGDDGPEAATPPPLPPRYSSPPPLATEAAAPEPFSGSPADEGQLRQELQASALRAKLKAQAMPEGFPQAGPEAGSGASPPATSALPQSRLLLIAAIALLIGAGYLLLEIFTAPSPPTHVRQRISTPASDAPEAGPADPATDRSPARAPTLSLPPIEPNKFEFQRHPGTGEDHNAAPPLAPRWRRHVPETVTDDLSQNLILEAPRSYAATTLFVSRI